MREDEKTKVSEKVGWSIFLFSFIFFHFLLGGACSNEIRVDERKYPSEPASTKKGHKKEELLLLLFRRIME
jgi:hypothetical protein